MPSVCFYFQVHQPMRVKRYRVFDIGRDSHYFNDTSEGKLNNKKIIEKVAGKCYLPANALLLELLNRYPEFKVSFSLSGIFLEQLERYSPKTLKSFQDLVETGRVEILSETYYHSLAFLYSKNEFKRQVEMHKKKVKALFGVTPQVFRNTELAYNNELGNFVEEMGYKAVLAEGWDAILGWRSPNFVYRPKGAKNIKLLLKNYKLSDDMAFRFSSRDWSGWPLTAEKFAEWITQANGNGNVINLFMDYETFGEHQWEDTGIFHFLRALPGEIYKHPDNDFVTPSESAQRYPCMGELDVHNFVSWADVERDLSAWLGNSMQWEAAHTLYELEPKILATKDPDVIHDWRRLQTSDHLYYMCTKWFNDGDVHAYFNPYASPYEAFISYMNVLNDLKLRAGA
ncbi:glycoside hydrolase family 57 protein [bacterium]|nr:glycoside hydrolase family 57 protein [bacterium]